MSGHIVGGKRACRRGRRRSGWSGDVRHPRSPAHCKSVAKATEVRILDPPQLRRAASDLLQRGRGPLLVRPAQSAAVRLLYGGLRNIAGTRSTRPGCSGCGRRRRECLAQAVVLEVPAVDLDAHTVNPSDVLIEVFCALADDAGLSCPLGRAESGAACAARVLTFDDLNGRDLVVAHTFDRTSVRRADQDAEGG